MSKVPADLKYAKSHEWVRMAGDIATVGITDHAQHELTDIVFVELPKKARVVKAGEAFAVVESVKTASDIYSPVSGEVVGTNEQAVASPALINEQPYDAGWLVRIRVTEPAELDSLLSATEYQAQIGGK